jgi:hypothetical protein
MLFGILTSRLRGGSFEAPAIKVLSLNFQILSGRTSPLEAIREIEFADDKRRLANLLKQSDPTVINYRWGVAYVLLSLVFGANEFVNSERGNRKMSDDRMNDTRVGLRDFLGAFVAQEVDMSENEIVLKVSPEEFEALGEFFVQGLVGWMLGIQITRQRPRSLIEVIPATRTEDERRARSTSAGDGKDAIY